MGAVSQGFHKRLLQSIVGVEGVIQIEDDLLVHGQTQEQHDKHLNAILNNRGEKNSSGVHLR